MKKSKNSKILSHTQKCRILQATRLGVKAGPTWRLIHKQECTEEEINFNANSLLKRLSAKFNFLVIPISNPNNSSKLDSGNTKIRYRYVLKAGAAGSAIKSNSRDFCRTLMAKNLLYRIEDINTMSFRGTNPLAKQNYSVFQYAGAWNCRHRWERLTFLIERDNKEVGNNRTI